MSVIQDGVPKIKRIETLDWLRGLVAISIMLYHLYSWMFVQLDSQTLLGRLGIYGVSIFFVLSGLSMAIVYHEKISTIKSIVSFLLKRFFRIVPLLFLVTTIVMLLKHNFDLKTYFLNITGLFGIFEYDNYVAIGAWSIGNEIVYYLFTPVILFLYDKNKFIGNIIFVISLALGYYFSFHLLDSSLPLSTQWSTYINPFNNFFLFIAGIFLYYNFRFVKIGKAVNYLILILCLLFFIFYPVEGNQINIVTGITRIAFCFLSIFLVLAFFKLEIQLPAFLENMLDKFGMATYGVYIYHPVIYGISGGLFLRLQFENDLIRFLLVCVITIITALFSYYLFEIKISNLGKKIINKYL